MTMTATHDSFQDNLRKVDIHYDSHYDSFQGNLRKVDIRCGDWLRAWGRWNKPMHRTTFSRALMLYNRAIISRIDDYDALEVII